MKILKLSDPTCLFLPQVICPSLPIIASAAVGIQELYSKFAHGCSPFTVDDVGDEFPTLGEECFRCHTVTFSFNV